MSGSDGVGGGSSGGAELAIPFRILDCCALVGVDIPKQLDAGGDDWLDQPISKPAVLHCFSGDVGSASDLKVSSLLANHHPAIFEGDTPSVGIASYKEIVATLPAFVFPGGEHFRTSRPTQDDHCIFSYAIHWSGHYVTCLRFYFPVTIKGRLVYAPAALCFLSRVACFSVLHDLAAFVLPFIQADTCTVALLEEMVQLASWVPHPLSGAVSLRFFLQGHEFIVRPSPHEGLPLIDTHITPYFQFFSPQDLLMVVLSLAFDKTVIVFSSDVAEIAPFCQALLGLLYPLEFLHTYVPIVPDADWVQSPTPMLAGMHASMQRDALRGFEEPGSLQPVFVNMDTGIITLPDTEDLPKCPSHIVHQFVAAINQVKKPFAISVLGRPLVDPLHHKEAQLDFEAKADVLVREAFLRTMVSLLKRVKECISFDLTPPLLHTEAFLALQPEESLQFFQALITSSAFNAFVCSRTRHRRDLFDVLCSAVEKKVRTGRPHFFTIALDPEALALTGAHVNPSVNVSQLLHNTSVPSGLVCSTPASAHANGGAHHSNSTGARDVFPSSPVQPSTCASAYTTPRTHRSQPGQQHQHQQQQQQQEGPASSHRRLSGQSSTGTYGLSSSLCEEGTTATPTASNTSAHPSGDVPADSHHTDFHLGSEPPSPLPTAEKSKMFTPQTHAKQKQRLRSLPGSPLSREPSATAPFQDYCKHMLAILDEAIAAEEQGSDDTGELTSVSKSLFYLRAVYKLGLGKTIPAFQDLDKLREDGISFPTKRVAAIISGLSEVEQMVLRESSLVKRSPMWQEIFKMLAVATQADLPLNMLPDEHNTQIRSFRELQKACTGPMDRRTFSRWTSTYVSCTVAKAEQAFTALSSFHDNVSIPAAVCQAFFQELRDDSAQLPLSVQKLLKLDHGESVLKCQAGVRAREVRELGRLILTHKRVFLARSDSSCRELLSLAEVRTVERTKYRATRLSSHMDALQIVDRNNCKTTLVFFSLRDKWFHFITELVSAHKVTQTRGSQLLSEAKLNILLVDAIHKVTTSTTPPSRDSEDDVIANRHVRALFTNQVLHNAPAKQQLSRRRERGGVDLSPGMEKKRTVERIIHVFSPDSGDQLWCGLGDGTIQLVVLPTFILDDTCIQAHTKRITALMKCRNAVWSSGFDFESCVIDIRTYRILEKLTMPFKQPITKFTMADNCVWGCGLDGFLFCWNPHTRDLIHTLNLNDITSQRVTCFCVQKFADAFWVGCGDRILILADSQQQKQQQQEQERQRSSVSSSVSSAALSPSPGDAGRARSRLSRTAGLAKCNLKDRLATLAQEPDDYDDADNDDNDDNDTTISGGQGDGDHDEHREAGAMGDDSSATGGGSVARASSLSSTLAPPRHRLRSASIIHQDDDDDDDNYDNDDALSRTSSVAIMPDTNRKLRSTITTAAANGFTRGNDKDIWCFSQQQGIIEIRNMDTLSRAAYGGSFTVSCGGFTSIVRTQPCMWAAGNNGSIYALDPVTHACMMEYSAHTDRVRCLCVLDDAEDAASIVSGSASGDGTLSVWRHSRNRAATRRQTK